MLKTVLLLLPACLVSALILPDTLSAGSRWTAAGVCAEYPGKALYDYVDGGADAFFRAGFVNCLVRTYKGGNGKCEIETALFLLKDSAGGRTLFLSQAGDAPDSGRSIALDKGVARMYGARYYAEITDRSGCGLSDSVMAKTILGLREWLLKAKGESREKQK